MAFPAGLTAMSLLMAIKLSTEVNNPALVYLRDMRLKIYDGGNEEKDPRS